MVRKLLMTFVICAALAPAAQAGELTVYTNNVENLPESAWPDCKGDYTGLLRFMASKPPDVFLVQQISDLPRLNKYVDELSAATGIQYSGTIAIEDPKTQNTRCNPDSLKEKQTNAIIWRNDVLTPIESGNAASTPRCRNAPPKVSKTLCYPSVYFQGPSAGCQLNPQARSTNAVLRLQHDDGATFTFASIHWPSGKAGSPNQEKYPKGRNACAQQNAAAAKTAVSADADALRIFGGDANIKGSDPWRRYTQKRLGFTDVMGVACARKQSCLKKYPTAGARRIDFIFAQRGDGSAPGLTEAATLDYGQAPGANGLAYSGHRAIYAKFTY